MTDTKLYQVEDGWIEVVSGGQFHFGDPSPDEIHVEDIAYSLSRLCRYNGHTKRHYSVAEHCCIMADWVAEQAWSNPQDVLTALHHDDAEYIIGDLARPVKVKMPQFKEVETVLDQAVALKFGTIWPFPDWLKDADARILNDERRAVMNRSDNEWGTDELVPLGVKFMSLAGRSSLLTRRAFLRRHYKYTRIIEEGVGAWLYKRTAY